PLVRRAARRGRAQGLTRRAGGRPARRRDGDARAARRPRGHGVERGRARVERTRSRARRGPLRGGARAGTRSRERVTDARVTRADVGGRSLVRAVPAWAWVAGIVVVSAAIRFLLARRMVAPWIMVDELIYSELAKSFAEHGRFLIRDASAGSSYGLVYPVLISPAYRVFAAVPDAYEAAKAINSVLMSLPAIP